MASMHLTAPRRLVCRGSQFRGFASLARRRGRGAAAARRRQGRPLRRRRRARGRRRAERRSGRDTLPKCPSRSRQDTADDVVAARPRRAPIDPLAGEQRAAAAQQPRAHERNRDGGAHQQVDPGRIEREHAMEKRFASASRLVIVRPSSGPAIHQGSVESSVVRTRGPLLSVRGRRRAGVPAAAARKWRQRAGRCRR
jgi:hypothetical protein